MFGELLNSKSSDKAGFYMYNIIANHVFKDGYKYAGLEADILFLDMNVYKIDSTQSK